MKSLRIHAHGSGPDPRADSGRRTYSFPEVKIEDVPVRRPNAGEAVIRVEYCGICGSDFSMAKEGADGHMDYGGLCSLPVTLGHEFSGLIEEADGLPKGCPVVAEETTGCGNCADCLGGREHACKRPEKTGFTRDGAYAPLVIVPERKCWSIEPMVEAMGMDKALRLAALIQPYAIAYSFLFPEAEIAGKSLLFLGAGPLGLCGIDLARAFGAKEIHVIEPDGKRMELAGKMGATHLHAGRDKIPSVDWIVDSSGSRESVEAAGCSLTPDGTIVLLSKSGDLSESWVREIFPPGVRIEVPDGPSCPHAYPRMISLLAEEALRSEFLVDRVVTLEQAADILSYQRKGMGKILVRPE